MERYTATLHIRHRQRDGEELLSEGEMLAEGALESVPGGWFLRYTERLPDGCRRIEAEAELLEDAVRVRRYDGISRSILSEVCYREHIQAPMRYETDGYVLSFSVYPQKVQWRVDPPSVCVRLEYYLKTSGSDNVFHEVSIWTDSVEPADVPPEGGDLKARARGLLDGVLGIRWGFVRWAEREDALLVTDAGRAAKRLNVDSASVKERLTQAGWRVQDERGLWWLDPPETAHSRALRARRLPGDPGSDPAYNTWRDGDLGELQSICAALLRVETPEWKSFGETHVDEPTRVLLRGAWKNLRGTPARANRWMRGQIQRFAIARRSGGVSGEYVCGVLLQHYLRRMGCGLPTDVAPTTTNKSAESVPLLHNLTT